MASTRAIRSVGDSLISFLRNSYPGDTGATGPEPDGDLDRPYPRCLFELLAGKQLTDTDDMGTTLTLFLYRVTINEHLRNVRSMPKALSEQNGQPGVPLSTERTTPLSVDLHYLMTVWADAVLDEQLILAWAMRQLYLYPTLDSSVLNPDGGWAVDDMIQIVPADLCTEDMMRIWDALEPSYRISVPYVARVVRIDAEPADAGPVPVLNARFALQDNDGPNPGGTE